MQTAVGTVGSVLNWMIEEPGELQSMGSRRAGHDWATSLSLFTFMHWRRKWQHTPVFLPGESQGQGSLVGCRLWGHTESDNNWSDLAASWFIYFKYLGIWYAGFIYIYTVGLASLSVTSFLQDYLLMFLSFHVLQTYLVHDRFLSFLLLFDAFACITSSARNALFCFFI